MKNINEKELFRHISEGGEAAFREIFDRYKGRFYGAALKVTRSPDASKDIVQEIFVTLWMRRAAFLTVENPVSYLFAIVYNTISNHFKKIALEKRAKESFSQKVPTSECLTEEMLEEKESWELLQKIIRQLPAQQKRIYRLSKLEGLSRDEIAQQLNISPHTVKNQLLKAVKYVREHFREALPLLMSLFI